MIEKLWKSNVILEYDILPNMEIKLEVTPSLAQS